MCCFLLILISVVVSSNIIFISQTLARMFICDSAESFFLRADFFCLDLYVEDFMSVWFVIKVFAV